MNPQNLRCLSKSSRYCSRYTESIYTRKECFIQWYMLMYLNTCICIYIWSPWAACWIISKNGWILGQVPASSLVKFKGLRSHLQDWCICLSYIFLANITHCWYYTFLYFELQKCGKEKYFYQKYMPLHQFEAQSKHCGSSYWERNYTRVGARFENPPIWIE